MLASTEVIPFGVDIGRRVQMAEELEVLWKKLSFTEEEGVGVDLGNSSTRVAKEVGKNCAIMKIILYLRLGAQQLVYMYITCKI